MWCSFLGMPALFPKGNKDADARILLPAARGSAAVFTYALDLDLPKASSTEPASDIFPRCSPAHPPLCRLIISIISSGFLVENTNSLNLPSFNSTTILGHRITLYTSLHLPLTLPMRTPQPP